MLPACASLTIVAAMSEESVMKQAVSPESPVRVRGQFRAITLGIGASALAMACSFGQIDSEPEIREVPAPTDEQEEIDFAPEDGPATVGGNGQQQTEPE